MRSSRVAASTGSRRLRFAQVRRVMAGSALLGGMTTVGLVASAGPAHAVSCSSFVSNTSGNAGDSGSLPYAVANASSGDTICFDVTGIITLTGPMTVNVPLTILGPGAGSLAVSGSNTYQIFSLNNPASTTASISGLTLEDGIARVEGGAVETAYEMGNASLSQDAFVSNTADDGGAVFNGTGDTMTLTNDTFSKNSATGGDGGAISNRGTISASGVSATGNTAPAGGAIENEVKFTGSNVTLMSNSASSIGGGLYNSTSATMSLTNSLISGNSSSADGGGAFNDYGALLSLLNVTVTKNTAFAAGGGIYSHGAADVYQSVFTYNGTGSQGGGALWSNGTLYLSGTTIKSNTTSGNGGGINNTGNATLSSGLVASNLALNGDGGGIYTDGTLNLMGSLGIDYNAASDGGGIFYEGGSFNESNSVTIQGNSG